MSTRGARHSGFTLLEVLIALAIASLTMVTALGAISAGQRNRALAQLRTRASMLAREKLAELEAEGYPDPDPEKAVNPDAEADQMVWTEEGEFETEEDAYGERVDTWRAGFYWQVIIESVPTMEGIRIVTVRVFTKRFRARKDEARWRDYIEEDYRFLVEVVTYRTAHYQAEAEAK